MRRIFLPHPHFIGWGGIFFYWTSAVTFFFYSPLNIRGIKITPFSLLKLVVALQNRSPLGVIWRRILDNGWGTFLEDCYTILYPSFYLLLLFWGLLITISVVNTALVSIPEVHRYIITNHGESLIKERGYKR